MEKAIALKAGVLKKVEGAREKSEKAKLVIDSLELALDMEAEGLWQDFAKAKLEVTEVGNHLECVLVSADDEFTHLPQQAYEIEWWYQGVKVTKKASQYDFVLSAKSLAAYETCISIIWYTYHMM